MLSAHANDCSPTVANANVLDRLAEVVYLTYPDLLSDGQRVLGGEMPVRDAGLLESALARPRAMGTDAYRTLAEKTAALTHSFVRNHGLIDSNERLGVAALIACLGMNGRRLTCPNDDAYAFTINIASVARHFELGPVALAVIKRAIIPFAELPVRTANHVIPTRQVVIVPPDAGASTTVPRVPRLGSVRE